MRFHGHSTEITTKANRVLGMIKKSFEYLDPGILTKLFTTLVRPILEYNNPIWGPHFMLDQRRVEKIQRRATRLLPHLQDKSYSERLSALSLPSLSYRRHRGDLILLYKIITILILISQIYSLILLVLPGATSSNYLNLTQGYYADPIIFSID